MMTRLDICFTVRAAAVVLITGMLVACASQPPVPQDRFYRLLAVMAAKPLVEPILPGTLEVQRFGADGLTAGRPITYVEANDANQLLEYNYHFWTQPPTIMLRDEVATYLRAGNVANLIVTPDMRLTPDHVMTGRIRKLEQILGSPNKTEIELEIAIRRVSDNEAIFLKSYRHENTQDQNGVAGAVDALNESLNLVLADVLADLRGL